MYRCNAQRYARHNSGRLCGAKAFTREKFNVVAAQSNAVITAAVHDSYYTSENEFGAD